MLDFKVDRVHTHFNYSTNQLTIWLFNDDSFYAEKSVKRVARYDFGRTENDRKVKLEKGIYRQPYKDGWKYIINAKLHSRLVETVERYNNYGFTINEDGEEVPFTYLRHNRKALGIHYLIERYVNREYNLPIIDIPGYGKTMFIPMGFIFTDFIDEFKRPYFPTPQSYNGRNPSKLI